MMYDAGAEDIRDHIPLWKEILIRIIGERWGYYKGLLAYRYRGNLYVIK